MDTTKFVEAVGKSGLPFVYSGDKLQDEKCQKVLKEIGFEGTVLGVMTEFLDRGLVVTEKGIWFSPILITVKGSKSKGAFPFDSFILHDVTLSSEFSVEFIMWDIGKSNVFTCKFTLMQDIKFKDTMNQELEGIFKTLVSKTGTEYVEKTEAEKDPNVFDFEWDDIHSIITLDGNNIIIKKLKIDEKTKIQTPKGSPVTIPRSAVASISKGKSFVPLTLLKLMGAGIGMLIIGCIFLPIIGIIAFLIFTALGLSASFPMSLTIKRKDGQKFSMRFYGNDKDNAEYERFINTIF